MNGGWDSVDRYLVSGEHAAQLECLLAVPELPSECGPVPASSGSVAWSRTCPSQLPAVLPAHSISAWHPATRAWRPSRPQVRAARQLCTAPPRDRVDACSSARSALVRGARRGGSRSTIRSSQWNLPPLPHFTAALVWTAKGSALSRPDRPWVARYRPAAVANPYRLRRIQLSLCPRLPRQPRTDWRPS
jgi:hypothetical protein